MPLATTPPENMPDPVDLPTRAGLRLAIIATPRSGNIWLRRLLADIYAAPDMTVHNPVDVDWDALPSDVVLQIPWQPTAALRSLLQQHGFGIVVLARHPLDVLLSILHYAMHDASPQRWLEGEGGTEADIFGAMPCSAAFTKYATGPRVRKLLAISRLWWDIPGVHRFQYERLVADPVQELTALTRAIGATPPQPIASAVTANAISELRAKSGTPQVPERDYHFWQAKPGHWKRYLPSAIACALAAAHAEHFSTFDYSCDSDPGLTQIQADANWIDVNRSELTDRIWNALPLKRQLEHALAQRDALVLQSEQLQAILEERAEMLAAVDHERIVLNRQRAELQAALADAHQAIKYMSAAPTQRMASFVKRFLRVKG